MGFDTTFLGLPALILIFGLLMVLKDRNKPARPIDKSVLAILVPTSAIALWVFLHANDSVGPAGGMAIMLFSLAAPVLLLFLMVWIPIRLLSGLFGKGK